MISKKSWRTETHLNKKPLKPFSENYLWICHYQLVQKNTRTSDTDWVNWPFSNLCVYVLQREKYTQSQKSFVVNSGKPSFVRRCRHPLHTFANLQRPRLHYNYQFKILLKAFVNSTNSQQSNNAKGNLVNSSESLKTYSSCAQRRAR